MAIVVWAIGQKCGVQAGISRDVKQKGHGVVLEGKQREREKMNMSRDRCGDGIKEK